MRVEHYLRPFHENTIAGKFSHISHCVGAERQRLFYSGKFDNFSISQKNIQHIEILQETVNELLSSNTNLDSDSKEKFARLELSAHITCIHKERFMSKNMKIIKDNISESKNEMKVHLTYFEKWREYSISLKKIKMMKSEKNIHVTTKLQ